MIRSFPNTLRGRILLSQLGLFAVLLLGLGIVQSSILSGYLHDSTVDGIRQPARTELVVLGPCFVRTAGDLDRNAQVLAQLLGTGNTGVKIVDRRGAALADHALGAGGPPSRWSFRPRRSSRSSLRCPRRQRAVLAPVCPGARPALQPL